MLRIDKYGDDLLEATPAELRQAPALPQVDKVPAHIMRPIMLSADDADLECVPECPACSIVFSLDRFWDDIGNYS